MAAVVMLEIHKSVVKVAAARLRQSIGARCSLIMIPLFCDHGGKIDFTSPGSGFPPAVMFVPDRPVCRYAAFRCDSAVTISSSLMSAGFQPSGFWIFFVCVAQHHAVVADLAEIGDCKLLERVGRCKPPTTR